MNSKPRAATAVAERIIQRVRSPKVGILETLAPSVVFDGLPVDGTRGLQAKTKIGRAIAVDFNLAYSKRATNEFACDSGSPPPCSEAWPPIEQERDSM